jgi:hypothetical protein
LLNGKKTDMGRFRNTARFIFSIGGTDGISPIAKESEQTALLRRQNELVAEQNRLIRKAAPATPPPPGAKRFCPSCKSPTMASPDGSVPYVHVANGTFACPK